MPARFLATPTPTIIREVLTEVLTHAADPSNPPTQSLPKFEKKS